MQGTTGFWHIQMSALISQEAWWQTDDQGSKYLMSQNKSFLMVIPEPDKEFDMPGQLSHP